VTAEALANVARYARATSASARVVREPDRLVVGITDDGVGGADMSAGTGLRGLADRVESPSTDTHVGDAPAGGAALTARLHLPRGPRT
jgi:signal transduction histidine kinase